eukprot:m.94806 g.94806  ORF g.94806 m.94806 type:complete len:841 (+) comp15131_c0_seq1:300-2822(+)
MSDGSGLKQPLLEDASNDLVEMVDVGEIVSASGNATATAASYIELEPAPGGGTPTNQDDGGLDGELGVDGASAHPLPTPSDEVCEDAAIFLHEGNMKLKIDYHPQTAEERHLWALLHRSYFTDVSFLMSLLYLSLALFEEPAVVKVPYFVPVLINAVCLAFILVELVLRWKRYGKYINQRATGFYFTVAVTLLLIVDLVMYIANVPHTYHVIRALRPFYLLKTDRAGAVRRVARAIFQTLVSVLDVIVLFFFYVGVFAVIGVYLYSEDPDNWFFANLGEAYAQLFVLMTTCNYPNVMMPAYAKSSWNFFFFFVFLALGLYCLANLMLAIVYQNYTQNERLAFRKGLMYRRAALRAAFASITRSQGKATRCLDRLSFFSLMTRYKPSMTTKHILLTFRALNVTGSGRLSLQEWYGFYDAVELRWKLPPVSGEFQHRMWYFIPRSRTTDAIVNGLKKVVSTKVFDAFINLVVFAQTVFIFVSAALFTQDAKVVRGETKFDLNDNVFVTGMAVFLSIYILEVLMKVTALSFKVYWRSGWNRFDFILTTLGLIGLVIFTSHPFDKAPAIVVFRAFRLIRVLALRQSFQHIVTTFGTILPRMGRFGAVIFCVYYSFSIIGMSVLSNTVSNCPDSPNNLTIDGFCGVSYVQFSPVSAGYGHYQLNNFDNILRSYVTLFELMVVNDWNNTMGGHVAAVGTLARMFFMLYYVFQVLVVINVIVAFVLEAFQTVVVGRSLAKESSAAPDTPSDEDDDLMLAKIVEVSADEVRQFFPESDPAVERLNDVSSDEYAARRVKYRGWRGVTQLALFRLLYHNDIPSWIAVDEEGLGNDAAPRVSTVLLTQAEM